ncbi:hypothetical protein SAMN05216388_102511 [Halorientalis persicus]|uniref:Uncharacterized protein n=1 Tax=Halorientalis persicus TaxID=1367881 RepID=A0A1H8U116_9EURY|nr:hypothetical protein [Halorientalis persicus]SEO96861.1 hypothetical protein SAMN05216388_102511 [Halorientalis persicus]
MYLRGKDSYTDRPPTPVTVSDTQLQFGAEWCLHTAREIVSDPSDVVCISKEHGGSLNIGLSSQSKAQIAHVGSIGAGTNTSSEEKYDFQLIRTFNTPKDLYIQTEEPRLDISDLRPGSLEEFSISY